MKIHKKFVFLSLAVMTSLIFAKNVNAVVINNIRNINTEDVTVITTTTPTPKVEITIKPIKKIEIRTTLKKTNALKEINRRLESLNKLVSKTEGIVRISATQRETLLAQIKIEITKLEELRVKIEEETDALSLQEQKKSITDSYRIYALFIPKIEIIAHADKIIYVAETMSKKTTDISLLAKINESSAKAQSAIDLVMPLLPEQYPSFKTTLVTAKDMLKTARTSLNEVYLTLTAED